MTTDSEMKTDLIGRLDAIPSVDTADVEIEVDDGMVTLNGRVDSHQTRFQVERAARKIPGMRGLKVNLAPHAIESKSVGRWPY
jgi:osmotically-inducible protein OsmY